MERMLMFNDKENQDPNMMVVNCQVCHCDLRNKRHFRCYIDNVATCDRCAFVCAVCLEILCVTCLDKIYYEYGEYCIVCGTSYS